MIRAINESSRQFLTGAASYFGLPLDQLMAGKVGDNGDAMEVTLTLSLTLTDLVGIVKRAEQLEQQRAGQALDDFLGKPRAGMSEEQSAAFDAEGLTGEWRDPSTEGVGGRKVAHVDVPEEQGDVVRAVWIRVEDVEAHQVAFASDTREGCYLLHPAMLTDEQKAKYGVTS